MAQAKPLILTVTLVTLFLLNIQIIHSSTSRNDDDLQNDIAYLESQEAAAISSTSTNPSHENPPNQGEKTTTDNGHLEDEETLHKPTTPDIDERDVVVLKANNFSEFVESNRYVMVEFYAPWCGYCKALSPEYAVAATQLKGEGVVLAKVDGTEEKGLLEMFEVGGFPTVLFFIDGVHVSYEGQRTKEAIVTWVKKKVGPAVHNITTTEEAQRILDTEAKLVLGFLDSLEGLESEELAAAARIDDDITYYQTTSPEVAKLFHLETRVSRPALVLVKKEAEKISHFDGQFSKSAIGQFVLANKLPLVVTLNEGNAGAALDYPIKYKVLLFANLIDSKKIVPILEDVAKAFKGKIIFTFVDIENKEIGEPISQYFGVKDTPKIMGYAGLEDGKKYFLDGEITLSNIKSFAEDFVEDKLKPFYMSEPIPEKNDGDIKIVVGNNFNEIVLDKTKDVLLEVYAPWCGHCKILEPIYNRFGKYLRGIDSLVIAKMDGTANEHPRAKVQGFPTLLFFPAGNKNTDPIAVNTERTVVEFYKFLKKHASIPFKLQRPAISKNLQDSQNIAKDEL